MTSPHLDRDSLAGYRFFLCLCYATYGVAGLAFLARPTGGISRDLDHGWYQIWAVLFIIGGGAGLAGLVILRPMLSHYVEGLALLSICGALLVYLLSLSETRPALSLLLLASLMALVLRGLVLWQQITIRERESRVILRESD